MGAGPQSPPAEEDRKMDDMFSEQTPLENIPDDGDDYTDDIDERSMDEPEPETLTSANLLSSSGSTAMAATMSATTAEIRGLSNNKTNKKIITFAQRMEYLKVEHELKMQVLEEEKSYWQQMKTNSLQASIPMSVSVDSGESSEQTTYHLLSESIH